MTQICGLNTVWLSDTIFRGHCATLRPYCRLKSPTKLNSTAIVFHRSPLFQPVMFSRQLQFQSFGVAVVRRTKTSREANLPRESKRTIQLNHTVSQNICRSGQQPLVWGCCSERVRGCAGLPSTLDGAQQKKIVFLFFLEVWSVKQWTYGEDVLWWNNVTSPPRVWLRSAFWTIIELIDAESQSVFWMTSRYCS